MQLVTVAMVLANTILAESIAARGIAIAITGMAIVAFALLLIIAFISALPKLLAIVERFVPESEDPHVRTANSQSHPESQVADDDAVLAAIGFVLHSRLQNKD
ncbi:OadG family protein [Planctomycetes bacterium K23_9]|uniref:Oxaloacetate decarboxylase, gamma chain n=1 Tax=Stieleria marina TaxID=1930275 RepID=A0A517P388_9BACT|nr:Oxaloacetate decarboxylase, gamma chain [Planctomycetes bacterium K23_9]